MTWTRCSPPYAPERHTRTSTLLSHPAVRSAGRFALPGIKTKTKIEEEFRGRSSASLQIHEEECHEARAKSTIAGCGGAGTARRRGRRARARRRGMVLGVERVARFTADHSRGERHDGAHDRAADDLGQSTAREAREHD